MRFYIFSILFSLFFLTGTPVVAQIPTGDLIQIEQNPEFPRSNQSVRLVLRSYSTDINNATITWAVNGKQMERGTGLTTFTTETGKPGSVTTVGITITTREGTTVTKSVSLRPADVDLVWETNGYVPPFYKGRTGYVYQSNLKIVALPDFYTSTGTKIDPKTLTYTWKQGSTVLGSSSGYGKDSLIITTSAVQKPVEISVEVTGTGANAPHGESAIEAEAVAPQIVFYEESPLYGVMYNKAVGNTYRMKGSETTFVAVPYFFSNNSYNNDILEYNWTINNQERTDLTKTKSVTLRTKEEVEGVSTIDLSIKNLREIFQSANQSISIQFTKQQESEPIEF